MLTEKQHQTFKFIQNYINEYGYSPTTAEIAMGIAIKSRGVVYRYLQVLQSLGLIELVSGKRRNIIIKNKASLPLVGKIAAGMPIEAIENAEELDVLSMFIGDGRYALEVKGDSMIDEGIFDGDIVVCQETATANNNQIVVALVDNENATLKRFKNNQDGTITLFPSNPEHKPQTYAADRVKIQGVYVGLLRLSNN
ncbi:MAG: repressor LexA [Legionellales bacterium]|nr:repressor LexA [Legionellales bacterium]